MVPFGELGSGLREFLVERLPSVARDIDVSNELPSQVIEELSSLGGFDVESLGPGGVLEAVRLASRSSPALAHVILVHATSFVASGASGGNILAFSVSEPGGGSDLRSNLKTRAVEDGSFAKVRGVKSFTSNAVYASEFIVLAVGPGGPTLYSVKRDPDTVRVKPLDLVGLRGCGVAMVEYLDAEAVRVGSPGMGIKEALRGINFGRLGYAAIGIGIAEGALMYAYRASSARVLFGSGLLEMQGPRWMLAEVYRKLVAVRALVREAVMEAGKGWNVDPVKASIAKLLGAELAREATWVAIQLQGGRGLSRWSDAERLWRDSRILDIGEGARETLMDFIASRLLKSMGEGGEW